MPPLGLYTRLYQYFEENNDQIVQAVANGLIILEQY